MACCLVSMLAWKSWRIRDCMSIGSTLGIGSGVESVLDPVEVHWGLGTDGDHVESAGVAGPARVLLEKEFGGGDQLATLACIDAFQGPAPGAMTAGADFDEYYCIAVEHDQIKLAATTAPVLFDQAQAVAFQMVPCRLRCGTTSVVVTAQIS